MKFRNYNDFEIILLIKQGNEEAFEFMVNKYKFLIAKNIKKFNLIKYYDDIFQEALMLLYKSIIKFDEKYNKTFTRFFESNLNNRLITLKDKDNKYGKFLSEKLVSLYAGSDKDYRDEYISESEIKYALNTLSDMEKKVFQAKIIEKRSVRETAQYLNYHEKKIYNALDRIKNKLKINKG